MIDYRDWQVPLGRRFRALKLWFVIRHYGVEGLRHHVRRHVALARSSPGWVAADARLRAGGAAAAQPGVLPPPRRRRGQPGDHGPPQRQGELFLTHTRLARPAGAAPVDRPDLDRAAARGGGVEADSRGCCHPDLTLSRCRVINPWPGDSDELSRSHAQDAAPATVRRDGRDRPSSTPTSTPTTPPACARPASSSSSCSTRAPRSGSPSRARSRPPGSARCIAPLMRAGFIDYVSSTGANLYHDLHFALGLPALPRARRRWPPAPATWSCARRGSSASTTCSSPQEVLLETDDWLYRVLLGEEFRKQLGTSELHHRIGRYALETCRERGTEPGVLATAHELRRAGLRPEPGRLHHRHERLGALDGAPRARRRSSTPPSTWPRSPPSCSTPSAPARPSAVVILGGGAPKNFLLQTEPQLQEVLGIAEKGHDYFIQVTDARPDTGGLSGATPSEAVSWGKIDPDQLPNTVVCYLDSTVALPLIASYVLAQGEAAPAPPPVAAAPRAGREAPRRAPRHRAVPEPMGGREDRGEGRGERVESPALPIAGSPSVLSPLPWSGGGCYTSCPGVGL